jgi:aerobic-type carbon monoxide dehydrogenase small subunit (CoxS/CutS family)
MYPAVHVRIKENYLTMITLTVNGVRHTLDVDPSTPLLYTLRNHLEFNGPKFGCGLGQCGACTVIVGDQPTFSCLLPIEAIGDQPVRTIEGLGTAQKPGVVQQAFINQQAAQCGYCISGMVMRAQALLEQTPSPSDDEIRAYMEPNLCRCGTHMRIIAAIREASRTMGSQANHATAKQETAQ